MKRVLLDENLPRALRLDLAEFEVRTVQEEGWSSLSNGQLLRAAEASFSVLVTADKRLRFQQNIPSFKLAVVVVAAESTRLVDLRKLIEPLRHAIEHAQPGTVTQVAVA